MARLPKCRLQRAESARQGRNSCLTTGSAGTPFLSFEWSPSDDRTGVHMQRPPHCHTPSVGSHQTEV